MKTAALIVNWFLIVAALAAGVWSFTSSIEFHLTDIVRIPFASAILAGPAIAAVVAMRTGQAAMHTIAYAANWAWLGFAIVPLLLVMPFGDVDWGMVGMFAMVASPIILLCCFNLFALPRLKRGLLAPIDTIDRSATGPE